MVQKQDVMWRDGEPYLSQVGVVFLIGNTAFQGFNEPKAMRKCIGLVNDVMKVARLRGYKEEKIFKDTFQKGADFDGMRERAKKLLEYVDIFEILSLAGMEARYEQ